MTWIRVLHTMQQVSTQMLTNCFRKDKHCLAISFDMAANDSKDVLKNVDWKTVGETSTSATATSSSIPIVKKRLPKKLRQVPDYYFMPRLSRPKAFAIYGTCIAAGIQ